MCLNISISFFSKLQKKLKNKFINKMNQLNKNNIINDRTYRTKTTFHQTIK